MNRHGRLCACLEIWIPNLALLSGDARCNCFPYHPLAAKLCCCYLRSSALAHDMHDVDGGVDILGQVHGSGGPLILHTL